MSPVSGPKLDEDSLDGDSSVMETEQCTVSSFIFSDRNTDSFLTIILFGIRMYVGIFATNPKRSPKRLNEYLHFLKVAEAFELDGTTIEDFYDWVLEGCESTFSQVERPNLPTIVTLANYLHPETRCYHLYADDRDTLQLIQTPNDPKQRVPPGTRVDEDICSLFPSFAASQVIICADNPANALQRAPRRVRIEDCESFLFFKPYDRSDSRSAKRELSTYTKIRQANLPLLRTSRLFGLVHDDSDLLLGLLLCYIDCKASTLQCAVSPKVSLSIRQYWAAEITQTLTSLHEAGIVWGDAKPANILVDAQNDPWIIDFGGSYTQGWVEKDLAGTVEGDEQRLSKIVDYIFEGGKRGGHRVV